MYLTHEDIEATLRVIARRSADASRLVIAYHSPALFLVVIGLIVRRLGEPLRSTFTASEMRDLLGKYGFTVTADADLPALGATLSAELGRAVRPLHHMRIVTADRRP